MTTTQMMESRRGVRRGTHYEQYDRLVAEAVEETKIGGDLAKAQVFATLALAEATSLIEPTERLEISGSLTVDS